MNNKKYSIFLKRLGSQESGYSGDRPGQRGKYLLVSKDAWDFFPVLPESVRNSFCALRILSGRGQWVGVRIVYHNTRFHPNLGLLRDHDEKRIYRNNALDEAFSLDRDVIVLLVRLDNDSYIGLSDAESGDFAEELSKLAQPTGPIDLNAIRERCPRVYAEVLRRIDMAGLVAPDQPSIVNQLDLMAEVQRALAKEVIPTDTLGDPLAALQTVYRTQADFALTVRRIYEGKCAIRKIALIDGTPIGLEAAHIYPRSDSMNFLPSNGLLLSRDLHNAFDLGCWTISGDLKVRVHPKVGTGTLREFDGTTVAIPAQHSAFRPFPGYLEWHRINVFDRALFLRNPGSL